MSDGGDLQAEAARIRDSGLLGKSPALNALFDFLVATSVEGRAAKEAEVAAAVFSRGDFEPNLDASVRVYVHRLRGKLADFYRDDGGAGRRRLAIPKGEYRLILEDPGVAEAAQASGGTRDRWKRLALTFLAGALFVATFAVLWTYPSPAEQAWRQARRAPFWQPTVAEGPPIIIAIGDYYMFGEADRYGRVERLVREFAVNSRYDLNDRIMADPSVRDRYVDVGLRYYPLGVASALRDLLPVLSVPDRSGRVRVIPASSLTPEMIRAANIVYLGYFSGLGALRDPLFSASRFAVGNTYDELIDKRTGHIFRSAAPAGEGARTPARSFGYIASFSGPGGNRITIVAGTRDPALMQAAEFAVDPKILDRVADANAELLISVDSLAERNLSGAIIYSGRIDASSAWRRGAAQDFPDDAADGDQSESNISVTTDNR